MKVNMLGDRVLLTVDTPEDKIGSLYIPEQGKDTPHFGTVIAVGPGRFTDTGFFVVPSCNPGDRVVFPKYAGSTIEIDHKSYLVIRDSDILCKLAPEDDEP